MKVTQAGFPCVALMGSTMSKAQEHLMAEHFGSVVLMLDGDDAGRRATEEIADRLQRFVLGVGDQRNRRALHYVPLIPNTQVEESRSTRPP